MHRRGLVDYHCAKPRIHYTVYANFSMVILFALTDDWYGIRRPPLVVIVTMYTPAALTYYMGRFASTLHHFVYMLVAVINGVVRRRAPRRGYTRRRPSLPLLPEPHYR